MATPFPFALLRDVVATKDDFVARIPEGIHDKANLLKEVGTRLRFPYWNQGNWDALNDWVADLEWIPNRRVLLLHESAPHLPRKELLIYLRILFNAAQVHARGEREFVVAFPEQTRALTDAWSGFKLTTD